MVTSSGTSFSFVHAADLHLDTPFRGIHAVAPAVAVALQEASLDAFDAIVDLTIARDAAFLLVAGDVYDGAVRGLRAQLRFRAGLERLSARGIWSFVVHGNHDPVDTGWSAIADRWPERTVVFGARTVDVVPVERDGTVIAHVQGISYSQPAETDNLALRLRRGTIEGFAVGVLHCNVEGSPDTYAPYSPCTLDDLVATGLDYLALGHIHEHQVLTGTPGRSPWVVYPGNSQARSPRQSESGPKGAVVVEVIDGAVDRVEFIACDRVRFTEIEVPIDDFDDLAALEDELIAAAQARLDAADGRSIVVRGRTAGRGTIHRDLARPGCLEDLLRVLRDRAPVREPFIWWDDVRDDSSSPLDLADVRGRGDFAADLVDVADAIIEDPAALGALLEQVAAEAPRSLRGDLAQLIVDPAWAVTGGTRATVIALDALLSEEQ